MSRVYPERDGPRPFILGLTGSIGMGKSTVAGMLRDLGVPVFDADAEVHRMQGPDGALLPAIEAEFPGSTGPEGVKRAELGAIVFGDSEALARLEAIVHPAVAAERFDFMDEHRSGLRQEAIKVKRSLPCQKRQLRLLGLLMMTGLCNPQH